MLDAPTRARLGEWGGSGHDWLKEAESSETESPGCTVRLSLTHTHTHTHTQDTLKIGQLLQMLVPYVNTRGVNIYGNIYK